MIVSCYVAVLLVRDGEARQVDLVPFQCDAAYVDQRIDEIVRRDYAGRSVLIEHILHGDTITGRVSGLDTDGYACVKYVPLLDY